MKAKDLMLPVSECAKVAEDRSIYDAVMMLEACRQRFENRDYRPRVVLVYDRAFRIVGSLRHVDMMRALAPPEIAALWENSNSPGGSSAMPLHEQAALWLNTLANLQQASRRVQAKDVMYAFSETEYIHEHAPIEEALARLLSGPYLNLVVESDSTTLGILRLSDIFSTLCKEIKKSGMK